MCKPSRLFTVFLLLIILSPSATLTAMADAIPQDLDLGEIDREILLKETELFSINTNFRAEYTRHEKWEARRVALANVAAGGMANAGDITLIAQWWKYARRPAAGLERRGRLQSGCNVVLVAYTFLGAMHALNMGYDIVRAFRNRRKGIDAPTLCRNVSSRTREVDSLLEQRAALIEQGDFDDAEKRVLRAESAVMQDIRDLCLAEFEALFVEHCKTSAYNYVRCAGTTAACFVGGFAGALPVIRGLQETNLKMAGSGGIGFLISAGILVAAPFLMKGGSMASGALARKFLRGKLAERRCKAEEQLKEDLTVLERLASQSGRGERIITANLSFFNQADGCLRTRFEQLRKDQRFYRRRFVEDILWYGAMGGPQLAWGAMVARAGYRFDDRPVKAFTLVAKAATVNETAWASWLLHALQESARSELRYRQDGFSRTEVDRLRALAAPPVIGRERSTH